MNFDKILIYRISIFVYRTVDKTLKRIKMSFSVFIMGKKHPSIEHEVRLYTALFEVLSVKPQKKLFFWWSDLGNLLLHYIPSP